MDVDKAGILEELAGILIVCNRAVDPLCGIRQVVVPPHERAVRRKGAVDAPRLEINLDVFYPPLAGLQMPSGTLAWKQRLPAGKSIREHLLVQVGPARDAAAGQSQVDQVKRLLAEGPQALVVAWDAESQIWRDPAQKMSAPRSIGA